MVLLIINIIGDRWIGSHSTGMTLVHVDNGGCGPKDNDMGCDPILNTVGESRVAFQ